VARVERVRVFGPEDPRLVVDNGPEASDRLHRASRPRQRDRLLKTTPTTRLPTHEKPEAPK